MTLILRAELSPLTCRGDFGYFAVFCHCAPGERQALGFEFFNDLIIVQRIESIFLGKCW